MSGNDYDAKSQVFQVGYDKAVGKNVFGVAVDQTNTSSDLTNGKSDGSMTGISLYMASYKDNGMYSDIVLRGGKLRNDMDSYGVDPDKLDIDTFGYRFMHGFYFILWFQFKVIVYYHLTSQMNKM